MAQSLHPGTIAIRCRDMGTCVPFYRHLLGDEIAALSDHDVTGQPYHLAWFALGAGGRLVLTDGQQGLPDPGRQVAHLLTQDPAGEEARLHGLGIVPALPMHETKGGHALVLADPEGNEIIIGTPERLPGEGTRLPF